LIALGTGIVGAAIAGAAVYGLVLTPPPRAKMARFSIDPPPLWVPRTRATGAGIDIAISPDASKIVYRVGGVGADAFALRELGAATSVVLPLGDGVDSFSVSPDGSTLVFRGAGRLQSFRFGSAKPEPILEIGTVVGTDWLAPNSIVYSQGGRIFRIGVAGGTPELLAEPPANGAVPKTQYLYPEVVAGGKAFLYTAWSGPTAKRIEARRLAGGDPIVVVPNGSFPKTTTAGHLLFIRDGRLTAMRFDASSLQTAGEAVTIDENIGLEKFQGASSFDVADDGTFVACSGGIQAAVSRFVWKSRQGKTLGYVGPADLEQPRYPQLSHDGRKLAATVGAANQGQIWTFDLVGAAQPQKLTFEGHHVLPMWSPDDRQLVFWSNLPASDSRTLHTMPADGSQLAPTVHAQMPPGTHGALSIDGASLMFTASTPATQSDLMLFTLGSKEAATPWLAERFAEFGPAFSPDGKWVAYMSSQTGATEIWVRPFPGPGAPVRLTSSGGAEPVWSRDGREVFYQLDGKLFVVPVTVSGGAIAPAPAKMLFEGGFVRYEPAAPRTYDVARDGRILMLQPREIMTSGDRGTVTVVVGFDDIVRQRVK
jgi:serine/threonine-protein kinase